MVRPLPGLEQLACARVQAQSADQATLECRQPKGVFRVATISMDREPSGQAFVTKVVIRFLRALGAEVVLRRRIGSDEAKHISPFDDLLGGGRRAVRGQFFPVGHDVENPCGSSEWRLRLRLYQRHGTSDSDQMAMLVFA